MEAIAYSQNVPERAAPRSRSGEMQCEAVRRFAKGVLISQHEDLVAAITGLLGPNTTLLIKGSRFHADWSGVRSERA